MAYVESLSLGPDGVKLKASEAERRLEIVIGGYRVAGIARATWKAMSVSITSPIVNLTRRWERGGWAFHMACSRLPETWYVFNNGFTPNGVETAERELAGMFLNWLAVSRNETEVDKACRFTRDELAEGARSFETKRKILQAKRLSLRLTFKTGGLSKQEYDSRLKEWRNHLRRLEHGQAEAIRMAHKMLTASLERCCGQAMSLEEAQILLEDVAIIDESPQVQFERSV